jgi:dUTP pyrophosphatase
MMINVDIQILSKNENFTLPQYATEQSAGMDLSADIQENITLPAGGVKIIPTGIAISLPEGYEAQIRPRSGLAAKNSVTVLNTPGTIDADYRGEIKVIMINLSDKDFTIEPSMRIAQMVINQFTKINFSIKESLDETVRGQGGFGSTGVKALV